MFAVSHKNVWRTTCWLCITAVFMALNLALSSFGVPRPGAHSYTNNIIIRTAAVISDPLAAFMAGGVGAFGGDFFYPLPMFISLATHGLQTVIISVFSHYVFKKNPVLFSGTGAAIGSVIMVTGYRLNRCMFVRSVRKAAM